MACTEAAFQPNAFQNDAFLAFPVDILGCGTLAARLTPINEYRAALTPNDLESNGTIPYISS
jgi:hypothetical protein